MACIVLTGELFARIPNSAKSQSSTSTDPLALISRMDNCSRKPNQATGNRFKPYQNSHPKMNLNSATDNDDCCSYCKQAGHTIDDCYKKRWADTQWVQGGKKGSPTSNSAENRGDL